MVLLFSGFLVGHARDITFIPYGIFIPTVYEVNRGNIVLVFSARACVRV